MAGAPRLKPLLISEDGELVAVLLLDQRAEKATRERATPWHVHADTGRVLPWDDSTHIGAITERDGWLEATVSRLVRPLESPVGDTEPRLAGTDEDDDGGRAGTSAAARSSAVGASLARLDAVIRERYRGRPKGSYTTYLFEKGVSKIRKKLGEEAIELITGPADDLVPEAADLLYHLLVLLTAQGQTIEQVMAELDGRS